MIEIPADVLDRAAHAANPHFPDRPEALDLTTFAGEIASWIDVQYRLSDDRHLVQLNDRGRWIVQHPMTCRPNLFACRFNQELTGTDFRASTGPGLYVGVLEEEEDPPGEVWLVLEELADRD